MVISPYTPTLLPQLTNAYNKVIQNVPHCYPVNPEDFASAIGGVVENDKGHDELHSEAAFVAMEGKSILGFTHVGIERSEEKDKPEKGIIRFLWYERGKRAVGQALLDTAERYFRERNLSRVIAFSQDYRYRFYYLSAAYLSDHLDPVQALLGFNGYQRVGGEVYFDWPNYNVQLTPADVDLEIRLEWEQGHGKRPGLKVLGEVNGEHVGVCVCVSAGEYSHADEAQDWLFTTWLGVKDEFQGKGIGRYLLLRTLQEMHGVGYRHASISTSWQNFRAFLFYSNCGYHVVDWTYGFGRDLNDKDS